MASTSSASETNSGPKRSDYLTRQEVLEILAIKPQTLYAYVSRGLVRAVPQPNKRSSFYLGEDIERIRVRSAARAGFGAVAANAMQWGEPIITTSITQITEAGPRYRNRLALDLVRAGSSFEAVADFLWEGTWMDQPHGWVAPNAPARVIAQLSQGSTLHKQPHIVQLLILALGLLGVAHGGQRERIQSGVTDVILARQAIRMMAGVLGFLGPKRRFVALRTGEPIAHGLTRVFDIEPSEEVLRALNALLVLDVDHELTPSTFAARIAASSAADLHACLGAALNTHHSHITGNRADKVEELFDGRHQAPAIVARVKSLLASGQRVPGFSHPFYPNGDPRATMLLALADTLGRRKRAVRTMLDVTSQLQSRFGLNPSFELGSVAICRALGLTAHAGGALRSLARSAGWVAHIFEQRLAAFMIRPRARYVVPSHLLT